jgi:hypothetical protein
MKKRNLLRRFDDGFREHHLSISHYGADAHGIQLQGHQACEEELDGGLIMVVKVLWASQRRRRYLLDVHVRRLGRLCAGQQLAWIFAQYQVKAVSGGHGMTNIEGCFRMYEGND